MKNDKEISIHDLKVGMLKKRYGSCYSVYRSVDVDLLLRMWSDLHYLGELYTRTRLVPCNEEFRNKKAIPSYNSTVKRLKEKYPTIIEFQRYELITPTNKQTND